MNQLSQTPGMQVFKKLMSQDAADYDHLTQGGGGKKGAAAAAAAAADGAAANGVDAADAEAGTPGWVIENGAGAAGLWACTAFLMLTC